MKEADTRANLIDPKLKNCGWEKENIIREFFFTAGRKLIGNKRGELLRADYILLYPNTCIAFIEAKQEKLSSTARLKIFPTQYS